MLCLFFLLVLKFFKQFVVYLCYDKKRTLLYFQGIDIHVVIPTALKAMFDTILSINNKYIVTNILPQANDLIFKTFEHKCLFQFTGGTIVSYVSKHKIHGKKINFKPFIDIIYGKWKNDFLIGYILSIIVLYHISVYIQSLHLLYLTPSSYQMLLAWIKNSVIHNCMLAARNNKGT